MPCDHSVPVRKIFEIGSVKPHWEISGSCTRCNQQLTPEEIKEVRESLEKAWEEGQLAKQPRMNVLLGTYLSHAIALEARAFLDEILTQAKANSIAVRLTGGGSPLGLARIELAEKDDGNEIYLTGPEALEEGSIKLLREGLEHFNKSIREQVVLTNTIVEELIEEGKEEKRAMSKFANMGELYREALMIQNACNLGAVVKALDQMIAYLRTQPEYAKEGTDWVNKHPAVVLVVDKLADLAKCCDRNDKAFAEAYQIAHEAVNEHGVMM